MGIVVITSQLALVDYDGEWHDLRAQVERAVVTDDPRAFRHRSRDGKS